MVITILNGDLKQGDSEFSSYIGTLTEKLQEKHTVNCYHLSKMDIKSCVGCWNCWWKTPGKCTINDDAGQILASVINSDFIIFASPIMAGFTSSLLKRIHDRFVGLVHPYILIKEGECHHKMRYDKYPDFGILLSKEADTDDEDLQIIDDVYDRFALNFHCEKRYTKIITETKIEEIIDETCNNKRIAKK
ncbi:MAG: NAD(P)H-dependent oxidoreductase [Bacteroidota bacterium]